MGSAIGHVAGSIAGANIRKTSVVWDVRSSQKRYPSETSGCLPRRYESKTAALSQPPFLLRPSWLIHRSSQASKTGLRLASTLRSSRRFRILHGSSSYPILTVLPGSPGIYLFDSGADYVADATNPGAPEDDSSDSARSIPPTFATSSLTPPERWLC
jgi:hypothetical protein